MTKDEAIDKARRRLTKMEAAQRLRLAIAALHADKWEESAKHVETALAMLTGKPNDVA